MEEPKVSEMTEFGKALWMIVTDKGPYSRAGFAKLLGQRTGWKPSRQAMSNWLKGERDAPLELIPATVMALDLDEETQRELEHLFVYGQRELSFRTFEDSWQERRKDDPVPEEPGTTQENEAKLQAERERTDRRDEEKRREREKSDGNGRVSGSNP